MRSLRLILGGACLLGIALFAALWMFGTNSRPNILFITLDTTRADRIGCYGYAAAETPTIDALAKRGVLFERAYASAPMTAPSHTSMFTGLFPPEHGVWTNGGVGLPSDVPVLAETLQRAGYATAGFIASMVLEPNCGLNRGFDHYDSDLPEEGPADDGHGHARSRDGKLVVDAALAWLNRRPASSAPFFCWVHLFDPHEPYLTHAEDFGEKFAERPYDAEIAYVDRELARLFAALEKDGRLDRTVIVIIGDHGEGLGDHGERQHGYMLHDSTLRVPFLIADPRKKNDSRRVSTPVSLVDAFPTLLTLAGLKPPPECAKRDLTPALRGESLPTRVCYSQTLEAYQEARWSPLQSLTTDRWRYVRTSKPELYDLQADPGELQNLAGAQPDLVSELDGELAQFLAGLKRRSASQHALSERERRQLESLGYIGASGIDPNEIEFDPERPDIKDMIVHFNALMDARKLIELEQYDQAMAQLRPLAETVPNFPRASFSLGLCLFRQDKLQEAAPWFERVLESDPNYERAHDALGFIYLKLRKLDLSEKHYLKALELRPNSENAILYLGEIAQRREQYPLAMRLYAETLRINPGNRQAREAFAALQAAGIQP